MCGINGCIDKTGQKNLQKTLATMNQQIVHRGPDDTGIWVENNIGLGMQRLAIIDLQKGQQPMHNPNAHLTLVFNGEIYNYQALKKDLQKQGLTFDTTSDTEVILKLYEVYGTASFGMLDGMFAFSLYDAKKNKIFCARDFFGEKPLYYYSDEKTIAWASELKSLKTLWDATPTIDSQALSLYFRLTYIPAPFTIYKGVKKLVPNQVLAIDTIDYTIEIFEIKQASDQQQIDSKEQAIEYIHDAVFGSVASRSVADVPLSSFLSGGVDSSIVSLCLAKQQSTPIDTFSIGFDNPLFDESENAKTVATIIGSHHHNFILKESNILDISEEVLLNFDEPYADSSALAAYWVAKQTAQQFKVALTGDGGDEIFGGYNKYRIGKYSQWYLQWVPKPLDQFNRFIFKKGLKQRADERGLKYKARKFLNALSDPENTYLNIISMGVFSEEYDQLFQNQWKQTDVFAPYRTQLPKTPKHLKEFQQIDRLLSLDGDLLTKVDRTSMYCSLECRAPLLNKQLWFDTQQWPEEWMMYQGDKKHLLKAAFAPYFPNGFFNQPKKGFNVPVGNWLRTVYRKQLLQYADKKRLENQGIFNYEILYKWVSSHLNQSQDYSFQLWTFFCFQLWYYNSFDPS